MLVKSPHVSKGEQVLDDLRDFLTEYLSRPGAMSERALAKKTGLSHVSINKFRNGGKLYFDSAVQIAEAIGYDLSKSLKSVS